MKINIKALELIEKGLSAKTVGKLTESEVSVLHSRLVGEATTKQVRVLSMKNPEDAKEINALVNDPKAVADMKARGHVEVTAEGDEIKEDENVDMEKDPFELSSTQDKRQVGPGSYGDNDKVDKEMDSDDADGMGIMEAKKKKKKVNPWAICTAQLGKQFKTRERHLWNTKQKNKYERCVKDVKQSLKEGKNPISLFLESQIMNIVEKNIPARITKGDLMRFLQEDTTTAPTKPKEKPTTKPDTKPRPRPKHPGKNPNPGENPAPKARKADVSPEKAKDEVLDLIMKLLEN